jgi:hypothetical protein
VPHEGHADLAGVDEFQRWTAVPDNTGVRFG